MALIFQYGSNMDVRELNGPERLNGKAIPLGVAELDGYQIIFNVFSTVRRKCAVTSIEAKSHLIGKERIFGVLFHIPDESLMIMRQVEGHNSGTYQETVVTVKFRDHYGNSLDVKAYTYVGAAKGRLNFDNSPYKGISEEYKNAILAGMEQFNIPLSYIEKVSRIIEEHNEKHKSLKGTVQELFSSDQRLQSRDDVIRLRKTFRNFLKVDVGGKVKVYGPRGNFVFEVVKGPDEESHPAKFIYMSDAVRRKLGVGIGQEVIVGRHQ